MGVHDKSKFFDVRSYTKPDNEQSNYYDVRKAYVYDNIEKISQSISSRVNSWYQKSSAFFNESANRYKNRTGTYKDAYVSDSADYLAYATKRKDELEAEYNGVIAYIEKYADYLDKKSVNSTVSSLKKAYSEIDKIINAANSDVNYWSQWKDENAYKEWVGVQKQNEEWAAVNIEGERGWYNRDMQNLEKAKEWEKTYGDLNYDQRIAALESKIEWGIYEEWESEEEAKKDLEKLRAEARNAKAQILLLTLGKGVDEFEKYLSEKNAYLTNAERYQKGVEFASVVDAPDFEEYAQRGLDSKNNKVVAYRKHSPQHASDKWINVWRMNEDEVKIYSYWLAKEGEEKAEEYRESIAPTLEARTAENLVNSVGDNAAYSLILKGVAGLDQFMSGMEGAWNMLTGEEAYVAPSAWQIAASSDKVNQNLGEVDLKWFDFSEGKWKDQDIFGKSLGQVAGDITQTTANQLPSIMMSFVPVVGQGLSLASMGISAAGNAYTEMINAGYSKDQARSYGMLVGGSEAILGLLLDGTTKSGGALVRKLGGKSFESFVNGIDKTFARVAISTGSRMLGEFTEESLQTVLEPWFESVVTKTDYEAANWEEVLYSGLLGALSAGALGNVDISNPNTVVGATANAINKYKSNVAVGKQISGVDGAVNRLLELGSVVSADSVAPKIAQKINKRLADGKKVGAYTIAKLFNAEKAALTETNVADITKSLTRKGVTEADAKTISAWMAKAVEGVPLTEAQANALENNPLLERTFQDVIINPNSTVYQRTKQMSDFVSDVNRGEITQNKASTAENKVVPTTSSEMEQVEGVNSDGAISIEKVAKSDEYKASPSVATMVQAYESGQDASRFASEYDRVFNYAYSGTMSLDRVTKSGNFSTLTQDQIKAAYNAGAKAAKTKAQARDNEIKSLTNGKTGRKKGVVKGDGVSISDLRSTFNDTQNVAYKVLSRIAEVTGIDIVLYKSETNEKGEFVGAQGKYDRVNDPGTLYIDINAGLKGISDVGRLTRYTMLRTFSHEFSHFIENFNPIWYNELRSAVFEQLSEYGEDVDGLIQTKMEQSGLDYDRASREVVAQALTDVLDDSSFVNNLAEKHKNVFNKLLEKLKEFLADIKAYFSSIETNNAKEAKAMKKQIGDAMQYVESIVELFDKAAVGAVENYQQTVAVDKAVDKTEAKVAEVKETTEESTEKQSFSEKIDSTDANSAQESASLNTKTEETKVEAPTAKLSIEEVEQEYKKKFAPWFKKADRKYAFRLDGGVYLSDGALAVKATDEILTFARSELSGQIYETALPDATANAVNSADRLLTDAPTEVSTDRHKLYAFDVGGKKVYFNKKLFSFIDGGLLYYADFSKGGMIKSVNEDGSLNGFLLSMAYNDKAVFTDEKPSKLKSFSRKMQELIAEKQAPKTKDTITPAKKETKVEETSTPPAKPSPKVSSPKTSKTTDTKVAKATETSATPPTVETTVKLEDFGEKIGGARKDEWGKRGLLSSDLSEMNDRERDKAVKKDNVWKRPDYRKLIEGGEKREILFARNEIRKSLNQNLTYPRAATPERKLELQKVFVDTVREIQSMAEKATTIEDFKAMGYEWLLKNGYLEVTNGYRNGHSYTDKWRKNPALHLSNYVQTIEGLVRTFAKLDKLADQANFAVDAESKIPAGYTIHEDERDHTWYIAKGRYVVHHGLSSYDEALTLLKNAARAVKTKTRFVPRQLQGVHRKGPDYRGGRDVKGQDYLDTFGFKGGEFGNWLSEKDRRVSMNYGFDALKDLADALGVADTDISLNGNLSIAFGARGQGLSGASAHYERERHVINLTKMNGAGSLAHEWFHALDDFAGGYGNNMATDNLRTLPERTQAAMRTLLSTMQYRDATQEETDMAATKRYEQAKRSVEYQVKTQFGWVEKFESGKLTDADTRYFARKPTEADVKRYHELFDKLLSTGDASVVDELSTLRKEVNGHVISKENRESIGYRLWALKPSETEKVQKMRLRSDFYNNSRLFGELHQKDGDYWDSTVEMAARAFACYIADKTNAQNDYLSAHSDSAVTFTADKSGNPVIVKAFPEGQERIDINRAFDDLISAMKEDGILHERGEIVKPDDVQYQRREYIENKESDSSERSTDTELLGRGEISASDESGNDIRKSHRNTRTLKGLLGLSTEYVERNNFKAGNEGWLTDYKGNGGIRNIPEMQRMRRFFADNARRISRTQLKTTDTAGRTIPQNVLERFSDTVFKYKDGTILSLWHWTPVEFTKFKYGDIGFHAGTFDAAHAIMFDKTENSEKGYFKEMYFNSRNPLFVERDPKFWTPYLFCAAINNVLTSEEETELMSLDGYDRQQYDSESSIRLREMLKTKGYDSIVYTNDWEGGLSVIAFDNDQFYVVAENGISKDTSDTQRQDRSDTLTDTEVLEMATAEINVSELTEGERATFDIWQKHLTNIRELEDQRGELGRLYKEQNFTKGADRKEAAKTLERMKILDGKLKAESDKLFEIEQKSVLQSILKKARKVVEQKERAHGQELLKRYRERRENAAAIKKYRDRIKADVTELSKWILHPDNKNSLKHVPDVLKNTVIDFLTSVDFTSQKQLAGKGATKADRVFEQRMSALKSAIRKDIDLDGLYSGYIDLPPDFVDNLEDFIEETQKLANSNDDVYVLNKMDVEQLRKLSRIIKSIKKTIVDANIFHANTMFKHVSDAGDSAIEFMQGLTPAQHANGATNFLFWQQITPAYAFERFGDGGKAIYDALRRAEDKMAFNTQKIIDFADATYTEKETEAWSELEKDIKLSNGGTIKMTMAQIMGFYELSKQPDSLRRFLHGEISIDGINDRGRRLTEADVKAIVETLTPRQKEVADAMQKFMAETGGEMGNEVTVVRYGEKQFTNPQYYPIEVDDVVLNVKEDEKNKQNNNELYAVLNMRFTKSRLENAVNRIVIRSIFDVFSEHMASMAQYNAFALPLLDAVKWLNYKQIEVDEDGNKTVLGRVREEMRVAFGKSKKGGKGYAESFVINIIKAYNGTAPQGTPYDSLGLKALHNYNRAQIAYNMRVGMQQPLSITRAAMLLDYNSITKGMKLSPSAIKANVEEMREHSGIAVWKSLGFYDINVSRGLKSLIKHEKTKLDKFVEKGMWLAETADTITWSAIWSACKEQVQRKQKLNPNDKGYFEAVKTLFADVVYKTQVVDSVLNKSEFMRDKGFVGRYLGSFMSESVKTASMLLGSYDSFRMDMRKGMSFKDAWSKNGRAIGRLAVVYGTSALITAAIQSIADAIRDDDEYEEWYEKWLEAFWGESVVEFIFDSTLGDALNPFDDLPGFNKAWEAIKSIVAAGGVDIYAQMSNLPFFDAFEQAVNGFGILMDLWRGEDTNYTLYAGIYKLLQGASGLTGVSLATLTREVITAWNNTVGAMAPSLKVKDYDAGPLADIKYAFKDGYLSEEEATKLLLEEGLAEDENEAYYYIQEWSDADGKYSKYDNLENALISGEGFEDAMNELIVHGKTEKEVISQVKSIIGKMVKEEGYSEDEAIRLLMEYAGLDEDEARKKVDFWAFVRDNPKGYDRLNEASYAKYKEVCEPYGVSIDAYYEAYTFRNDTNNDEELTASQKKRKIRDYIYKMDIPTDHKRRLIACWFK